MRETKHTQVDNVALELGLELHRINLEYPNVFGVAATLDVDGDLGRQSMWPMLRRAISLHLLLATL